MNKGVCRVVATLSAAVFLAGCGGSTNKTETHGKRFTVDPISHPSPGQTGVAQPEIQAAPRSKKKITPAEARKLLARLIKFAGAHCPCTYEQTSSGPRLLNERHR